MPKKLTKDQKCNQQLRKEGQKDFKRVPREGKTASIRVTRRALCVRVSTETAERLKIMADDAGVHLWQMATRNIHQSIPGYDTGDGLRSVWVDVWVDIACDCRKASHSVLFELNSENTLSVF